MPDSLAPSSSRSLVSSWHPEADEAATDENTTIAARSPPFLHAGLFCFLDYRVRAHDALRMMTSTSVTCDSFLQRLRVLVALCQ